MSLKNVDKTQPPVKVLKQEATPPQRMVESLMNHRRMLKGMLAFTEQLLREAGIQLNP